MRFAERVEKTKYIEGGRFADLIRDADLAPAVYKLAGHLLSKSPDVVEKIIARWVGQSTRFGNV